DYYDHDETHHCLVGRRSRRTFQLGQILSVALHEANVLTGSMVFHLEEVAKNQTPPTGNRPRARMGKPERKGPPRKSGFKGRGR
ncbi:MAG: hypothetical protein K2X44_11565, partial [Magnetospirillum sp.]|nr:hypothetical protein [Magnetospirillum sp.]